MTIDIAIATYKPEGIERVAHMLVPPAEGVRYIVSWQAHEDAPLPPSIASRPDVKVMRFDGIGLSNNRNNALKHCTADIIFGADDDVTITDNTFEILRRTFTDNPEVDLALFVCERRPPKNYPRQHTVMSCRLPKGYYAAYNEIAWRRLTAKHLRMCPELGLNSPRLHGGEDEMFVLTAIHRGLRCEFFPLTVCRHPHASTGVGKLTAANLRALGCTIALTYGASAILRVPLKAWRVWRSGQASLLRALLSLTHGAFLAPGVRRRNPESLW